MSHSRRHIIDPEDEAALVRDVLKSGKRTYLADFSVLATQDEANWGAPII